MTDNKDLIVEAREACADRLFNRTYEAGLMRRLADALEARQLSENDREVLAKQLRDIGAVRKVDQDCSCQDCEGAAEWVNAPLSVVLDHFKTNVSDAEPTHLVCAWCPQPARGDAWHNDGKLHPSCGQIAHGQGWVPPYTPRDAVPDAATELVDAIRWTVEYVGNDVLPALKGWSWFDALMEHAPEVAQSFVDNPIHFPKLTDVEAERDAARAEIESRIEDRDYWHGVATTAKDQRDAALAAIARVRALETFSITDSYLAWTAVDYDDLLAALDGAPEPDDEPCDAEVHSWDHYRPEQIDSYWIRCTMLGKHDEHEDSHTGLKWRSGLPVEGESK